MKGIDQIHNKKLAILVICRKLGTGGYRVAELEVKELEKKLVSEVKVLFSF